MHPRFTALLVSSFLFSAAGAFAAHQYDPNKPITITGPVKEITHHKSYVNVHVAVKNAKGKTQDWEVRTSSPTALQADGTTRVQLKKGDQITVQGDQEKNGSEHVMARSITLVGGKTVTTSQSQPANNPEPVTSAAAQPAPAPPSDVTPPPANVTPSDQSRTLPRTATNTPLMALLGLLSLAGATALSLKKRLS